MFQELSEEEKKKIISVVRYHIAYLIFFYIFLTIRKIVQKVLNNLVIIIGNNRVRILILAIKLKLFYWLFDQIKKFVAYMASLKKSHPNIIS